MRYMPKSEYGNNGYAAIQGYGSDPYAAPQGYGSDPYAAPQGYANADYAAPESYGSDPYAADPWASVATENYGDDSYTEDATDVNIAGVETGFDDLKKDAEADADYWTVNPHDPVTMYELAQEVRSLSSFGTIYSCNTHSP